MGSAVAEANHTVAETADAVAPTAQSEILGGRSLRLSGSVSQDARTAFSTLPANAAASSRVIPGW